jgi:hypothetical protein
MVVVLFVGLNPIGLFSYEIFALQPIGNLNIHSNIIVKILCFSYSVIILPMSDTSKFRQTSDIYL